MYSIAEPTTREASARQCIGQNPTSHIVSLAVFEFLFKLLPDLSLHIFACSPCHFLVLLFDLLTFAAVSSSNNVYGVAKISSCSLVKFSCLLWKRALFW